METAFRNYRTHSPFWINKSVNKLYVFFNRVFWISRRYPALERPELGRCSGSLPARSVAGPGALYVGAWLSLCRDPALSVYRLGARWSSPKALCVGPRHYLRRGPTLFVSAQRFLCRGPALFVSGPGTLCVGARRSASGPGALCVGPRAFCAGLSMSAAGAFLRGPALSVSDPGGLYVGARRSLCRALCCSLAQVVTGFCGPQRSLCRAPSCFLEVCIGSPLPILAKSGPGVSVSGPCTLCIGPRPALSVQRFTSGPSALCVEPRRPLSRSAPSAMRSLCRDPALSGGLCVRARRYRRPLSGSAPNAVSGPAGRPALLSQRSLCLPWRSLSALFMSVTSMSGACVGPGALSVGAGRSGALCAGLCVGVQRSRGEGRRALTESAGARHKDSRSPTQSTRRAPPNRVPAADTKTAGPRHRDYRDSTLRALVGGLVSGPSAFRVGAWRSLCRGAMLCRALAPSLSEPNALCVGAQRSLGWGPTIWVSRPGALWARSVTGPGALCVGAWRTLCRDAALSVSSSGVVWVRPPALCILAWRSVCWPGALSSKARRFLADRNWGWIG